MSKLLLIDIFFLKMKEFISFMNFRLNNYVSTRNIYISRAFRFLGKLFFGKEKLLLVRLLVYNNS